MNTFEIKTFKFDKNNFDKIRSYNFGVNWPVVYLIEDGKEIYVGETTNVYSRSNQHYEKLQRRKLERIHIITDEEYNKSATLDIESLLIQYISADGPFVLQNGNSGLRDHNYFDRQKYRAKFEIVWKELMHRNIVHKELVQIRNSDLFKYSPYKALSEDQLEITKDLLKEIVRGNNKTFIIHGGPGTGKTVLATYLFKILIEASKTKEMKIGLVIPMTSLRKTLKKVFSNIKGLSSSMVIGPNEVSRGYNILIVDESHRLKRRKNITNYKSFDDTNKLLGLKSDSTELDWIIKCSNIQILFYDENQSVRPSDLSPEVFRGLETKEFALKTQLRVGFGVGGDNYIKFIQDLFDLSPIDKEKFSDYDFKIYDDIHKMVSDIKNKNLSKELCRIVSGYAWPWVSKNDPSKHDIEIDGLKLQWNSVNHNWVYSKNSINEVGCIHTVQGYDLNYAGVIIGPELSYDKVNNKLVVHPEKYMDINGRKGVDDKEELKRYIINIYKTLLTRGIEGTYVYIVDEGLRKYFKESLAK